MPDRLTRQLTLGGSGQGPTTKRVQAGRVASITPYVLPRTVSRLRPGEVVSLRDAMDRLFEESFFWPRGWMAPWKAEIETVPLDMYEEGNNLIAKASVPGVKPEELNVRVQDNVLTISGETKQEEERKEKNYHLREHRYGRFERSVTLPCSVQVEEEKERK